MVLLLLLLLQVKVGQIVGRGQCSSHAFVFFDGRPVQRWCTRTVKCCRAR